ncbi:hypothetical protein BSKO_10912 [Bryopsis sp. KO-2023]|nr:hypothetical protein BSKO_10912 [Bryopsis sp. KO-2023]
MAKSFASLVFSSDRPADVFWQRQQEGFCSVLVSQPRRNAASACVFGVEGRGKRKEALSTQDQEVQRGDFLQNEKHEDWTWEGGKGNEKKVREVKEKV